MKVVFRPISPEDNPTIARLLRAVLVEMGVPKVGTAYSDPELDYLYEAYQKPRATYYVVECDGDIMGGAGIAPLAGEDPAICELQKMYFHPKARGKGWGSTMIDKCLDFAKENDFKLCYIETLPNMKAAQKLYRRKGFDYIDHAMGVTGHTSCNVWLTKSLL